MVECWYVIEGEMWACVYMFILQNYLCEKYGEIWVFM